MNLNLKMALWTLGMFAAGVALTWIALSFFEQPAPHAVSEVRYACDDDLDTTKGRIPGVLTNCRPVNLTRKM